MRGWLRLFRAVNLPTVPGDVLVGAAAVGICGARAAAVAAACAAGVFLYMFGLADNDIEGAAADRGRPIPDGEVSMRAARLARGLCLFAALVAGAAADLPPAWWVAAFALAVAIVAYNRTGLCAVMGLCRALNVACGAAALLPRGWRSVQADALEAVSFAALVWFAYFFAVTRLSVGEEDDPARKRLVGLLIGASIYLQLSALLMLSLSEPRNAPLLVAGAALLVVLRLSRRFLPGVSAS